MKSMTIAAALSAAVVFGAPAQADVVKYSFTAVVSDLFEFNKATGAIVHVTSSSFAGGPVALGNVVQGQFSFNTDAPLGGYQPTPPVSGQYLLYALDSALSSMNFTVGGLGFQSGSTLSPVGQVANNASTFSGWDVFTFDAYKAYDPVMFQSGKISLYDSTGRAFSSAALPSSLNLADFSYRQMGGSWLRQADGNQLQLSATLTALEQVASVPEPATFGLFAAGLLAVALVRQRRVGLPQKQH